MLSGYSMNMMFALLATAIAASFFVGNAMNSVLGATGFGVLGNMLVLFFGLIFGLSIVDHLPYRTVPKELLIPVAIGISFALLFGLAVVKRLVQKV